MSKIFNVVTKAKLIGTEELVEADVQTVEPREQPAERPVIYLAPAPPAEKTARVIPLRISALSPIFPFDTNSQAAAEQYRIIRTQILHHRKKPQLIVVSSASSGDGKTITAINLAASFALKDDASVLLVDGDLRRPDISNMLGLPSTPGLLQVLAGRADVDSVVVRSEQFPNLFIISSGSADGNAAELLDSQNWRSFVEHVRTRFSMVIFDAPPIASVADYELLQLACDGMILVARPDHTDRAGCLNALKVVPREKLIGVVLNGVEDWWLWKAPGFAYYSNQSGGRDTLKDRMAGKTIA